MISYLKKSLLLSILVLCGLLIGLNSTLAADTNITSVVIDDISSTEPGATATYQITFTSENTIGNGGGFELKMFPVSDGVIGASSTTVFNFGGSSFASNTVQADATAVNQNKELSVALTSTLSPGTYTFTIQNAANTLTEGQYALGLSSAINASDSQFTVTDSFTITTDPCSSIVTETLDGVDAIGFGTSINVSRGEYTSTDVVLYTLAYATSQAAIDDDTAETVDMTTNSSVILQDLEFSTTYYVQVRALDANNCVVASSTVNADTDVQAISSQRYQQPTVRKIRKRSALVKWSGDAIVSSYKMQLWKGKKKIKTFKQLTEKRKLITKKYLKPNTRYEVRVKAMFVSNETSRWSKFKKFQTK